MPTFTCKIPPELDGRLAAASRARRMTKSALVREILEAQLKRRPAGTEARAYDAVKHLVGRLEGPSDLSSASRHLDDFGA